MPTPRVLRIGEVARRTGVAVSTLRAWERRYELLEPERTDGGHRLYGAQDIARVRRMQTLLDQGWSASAAAAEVIDESAAEGSATPVRALRATEGAGDPAADLVERLTSAFTTFDAREADRVLDDCLARLDVGAALDEVIFPTVRDLARGWHEDPGVIAREHFATHTIRPRLIRLLRSSTGVVDRPLVAASPEHEEHDLGVLGSAVVAATAGWNAHFLGARSPSRAIDRALSSVDAHVALIGSVDRSTATDFLQTIRQNDDAVFVLGGEGFSDDDPEKLPLAIRHRGSYRDVPETLARAQAMLDGSAGDGRADQQG